MRKIDKVDRYRDRHEREGRGWTKQTEHYEGRKLKEWKYRNKEEEIKPKFWNERGVREKPYSSMQHDNKGKRRGRQKESNKIIT